MAVAVLAVLLAAAPLSVSQQNSTADEVQRLGATFGADFIRPAGEPPAPSAAARDFGASGVSRWLSDEVERSEESIGDVPPSVREYLDARSIALWDLVAVLEKGSPEWGDDEADASARMRPFLPTVRLEKVLLAAALRAQREGEPIDAGRLLEASWALGRPVSQRTTLIDKLLTIGIEKLQLGVLRRIPQPPIGWMSRLGEDRTWGGMLDAFDRETVRSVGDTTLDAFARARHRLFGAVVDRLRKLSACEASRQSDEEIWRDVSAVIEMDSHPGVRASGEPPAGEPTPDPDGPEPAGEQRLYFKRDELPFITSALRRAARSAVDRELTLRILELRMDRAASRDGTWPTRLVNPTSSVCPEASYAYSSNAGGMEIRFEGSVADPDATLVLPLTFRTGKAKAKKTPTPNPR
ncbi:MAG TPA: hypothetical protein VGK26_10000 [Thermoanaerobaculia bacterium]